MAEVSTEQLSLITAALGSSVTKLVWLRPPLPTFTSSPSTALRVLCIPQPLQAPKNDPSGLSATLTLGSLHFVLSSSSYWKWALGIQAAWPEPPTLTYSNTRCKTPLLTKWQRHAPLPQAKVTQVLLNSVANQEIAKGKSHSLVSLEVSADSAQAYTQAKWLNGLPVTLVPCYCVRQV